MNDERAKELKAWNKAAGLLRSEVDELIEAVEKKNKEIHKLTLKNYAGQYWYERSRESLLGFSTKILGLLYFELCLKRRDYYVHVLPIKYWRDWKTWGYREEWYDGPHPTFHLGPFLIVGWEDPEYGNPKDVGEHIK